MPTQYLRHGNKPCVLFVTQPLIAEATRRHGFDVVWLNRGDGEMHQVLHHGDFLLDEGFSVADTGEQAVMASRRESALANVVFRDEESSSCRLGAVLGTIGEQGLQAGFDMGRYIDDEGGAHVRVQGGVQDLVRAMRGAWDIKLGETGREAGFVAQGRGSVVVGVTALPVRQDDHTGTQAAQDSGDLEAGFECVL